MKVVAINLFKFSGAQATRRSSRAQLPYFRESLFLFKFAVCSTLDWILWGFLLVIIGPMQFDLIFNVRKSNFLRFITEFGNRQEKYEVLSNLIAVSGLKSLDHASCDQWLSFLNLEEVYFSIFESCANALKSLFHCMFASYQRCQVQV